MTSTKTTKRALIASALSLLICVSMLIGSTFAWFTDNASTAGNTIISGNLDVQLLDAEGNSLEGEILELAGTNVSQYIEPNGSYEFEPVTIKNAGNVNLKYKVSLSGIDGDAKLLEVLTWEFIVDGKAGTDFDSYEGTLEPDGTHILKIRFTMDKDADKTYMNQTLSGIAINVTATQATGDSDSFQDDYDKLAEYEPVVDTDTPDTPDPDAPVVEDVGTLAELQTAFKEAADQATGDIVINLTKSFDVANSWTAIIPEGYNGANNVIVNGNGFSIKNLNETLFVGSFGGSGSITINDLTIENATISGEGYNGMGLGAFVSYSDSSGSITLNNCHLKNSIITCAGYTGDVGASYAGGLIGYASSATTLTNCSVTGSSISGEKSAGAIVGHGNADITVNGCEVSGCTIAQSLDNRTGAANIVGRMSGGCTLTLKGTITTKGNTIQQGNGATDAENIYTALGTPVTNEATLVTE